MTDMVDPFDHPVPDRAEYVIVPHGSEPPAPQDDDIALLEGIATMNEQFRGADGARTAKQLRRIASELDRLRGKT